MTRERERGTFENLLSTPALPIEVMTGKIVPYIMGAADRYGPAADTLFEDRARDPVEGQLLC